MNLNIYIYAFCRHSPKWFTKEEPKHKVHNFCIESTGTYKKIYILQKRSIFFVTHFRKWNPYIIWIHYTLSEIFQAFISWILMIMAYR